MSNIYIPSVIKASERSPLPQSVSPSIERKVSWYIEGQAVSLFVCGEEGKLWGGGVKQAWQWPANNKGTPLFMNEA